MLDRFTRHLVSMYRGIGRKFAHPSKMLDLSYKELQSSLIDVQIAIAKSIAKTTELQLRLEAANLASEADLKLELKRQQEATEALKKQQSELQTKRDKVYSKRKY